MYLSLDLALFLLGIAIHIVYICWLVNLLLYLPQSFKQHLTLFSKVRHLTLFSKACQCRYSSSILPLASCLLLYEIAEFVVNIDIVLCLVSSIQQP
jgi:hypothetical protein